MASETLFEAELTGVRGDAYRQVRENGGTCAYIDSDGTHRKVKYIKPVIANEGEGGFIDTATANKPGYWYDAPQGGAGIRVEDGDSLKQSAD